MVSIAQSGSNSILLDTNSLIYSVRNRIDLQTVILESTRAVSIFVPECVIDELKSLSPRVPEARAAITLAERFRRLPSLGKGDECILDVAKQTGASVLTNDRELIKRLKESGVSVMSIRGRRTVDFV